jgi:hypothetical protein
MLLRGTLVRTDVPEELSTSFIRVTRIGELGTIAATSTRRTVFLRSVRRVLVAASVVPSSPIRYPDEGGANFLRNVGCYKSHSA